MKRRQLIFWICLGTAGAASILVSFMISEPPLFWPLFGLLGAAGLILIARALGKLLLERPETYYDDP